MTFYLISDNTDTLTGMRLAGIPGVLAHAREEVAAALETATGDEHVGVVLMTEKLAVAFADMVEPLKGRRGRPLLIEIPDRHGTGRAKDSITRYVREAIGVRV
ncbi:MAG: V-type ATP synthase subunit F [Oscillospiraceae bacterium]|jgi:V/A-type H+-transporting ATPase subunit F|nr:V-type ATP synthase subunit F [Oscillospiraceae bacterium]